MPDFDFDDAPGTPRRADLFGGAPHYANGNGRGGGGAHRNDSPPLAALPVFKFFSSVNWRNQARVAPSTTVAPAPLLGAWTVSRFLAAVNWRNAASAAPQLSSEAAPVALPPTVDMVLQEFVWE